MCDVTVTWLIRSDSFVCIHVDGRNLFDMSLSTRCVAACCGVLRRVAVCCGVLRFVPVWCSVLQCVEVCYSVMQCVASCRSVS